MRGRRAALICLCAAMVLGGCRGEPEPEATPVATQTPTPVAEAPIQEFALPCYPAGGFHPMTGTNRLNLTLAPLLYRGLFSVDGHFQAQKDLCESYTVSGDGLVWTFRWKRAVFSDGTPVTGVEVAQSLEAARRSGRYQSRLSDVSRVTAGEGEVILTLSRPNGALPVLLDVPIIKEGEDPARPLGTGPYQLTGEGDALALTAKPGWDVPLDRIPLRSVASGDDLVFAFDAREVSLVDADLTGTNTLGYSGRFETTDYSTTTLLYVGCNTRSGACREEGVRRAVGRAFDRADVAERLLAGHAVASSLPVHPLSEDFDEAAAAGLNYDMDAAAAQLARVGWKLDEEGRLRRGRNGLTLKLLVNQENTYKVTAAESLAGSLRELGCDVTVEKLPWDDFTAALNRGDFDLFLGEVTLSADFDLEELLGGGGRLNYGGCSDAATVEGMNARRAAAEGERKEASRSLWERLGETAPILPLCFKNGSLLTQWGQVSGAAPTQRDVFAGLAGWTVSGS